MNSLYRKSSFLKWQNKEMRNVKLFSILLSMIFIFSCICIANAQKFDSSYSPRFKTKIDGRHINFHYKAKRFELMRFNHLGAGEAAIIFGGNIIYGNSGINNDRGSNNNKGFNRGNNRNSNRNNFNQNNRSNSKNFGGNNNRKFR
jgi:hypothetical protein